VVSRQQDSGYFILDPGGLICSNVPMAFLLVPLNDASGAPLATFAFRIPG
jgi:hypothetical protein